MAHGLPPTGPAALPLPGGDPEATVGLHLFLCGTFKGPRRWFVGPPGRTGALQAFGLGFDSDRFLEIPIVAFLIEHPKAGPILVDSGLDPSIATCGATADFGRLSMLIFRDLQMESEQALRAQLKQRGIDPDSVKTILMTHLHADHASGLSQFPGATALVSKLEWENIGGSAEGYNRAQLHDSLSYRLLDFEVNGRPDAGFARVIDLFDDGSVRVAHTPGHSPGHLSVIVRLADGVALLTGDAAYTIGTLRGEERPWRVAETAAYEDSLGQLRRFDATHPEAVVIPGHDMLTWSALAPHL
jgi:N-acyl homoserine lactone hydrolase